LLVSSILSKTCNLVDSGTFQAFAFLLQNLARDQDFDTLPSFGVKRDDEDMDLTYY